MPDRGYFHPVDFNAGNDLRILTSIKLGGLLFHCLAFALLYHVNRSAAFTMGAVPVLIAAGLWGLWGGAVAGLAVAFADIIIVLSTENEILQGSTFSLFLPVAAIGATGGLIGLLVDANRKSRRITTLRRVTTFLVKGIIAVQDIS